MHRVLSVDCLLPTRTEPTMHSSLAVIVFVGSVFLTLTSAVPEPRNLCPHDFRLLGKACYHISSTTETKFSEASNKCERLDSRATLVSYETDAEYAEVMKYLRAKKKADRHYWTDLQANRDGEWVWSVTGEKIGLTKPWCASYPKMDEYKDCALMKAVATNTEKPCFINIDCEEEEDAMLAGIYYICKYE